MSKNELDTALERFTTSLGKSPVNRFSSAHLVEYVTSSGKINRLPSADFDDKNIMVGAVSGALRKGYYVEIGPGVTPREPARIHTAESPSLGVDGVFHDEYQQGAGLMGIRDQETLAEVNARLQQQNSHTQVVLGDGRNMTDVPTGSVQEEFMGNVLLSPGMNPDSMLDVLTEAKRVLDPETGILIVGESDLVRPADPTFRTLRERFGTFGVVADRAGFTKRFFLDNTSDDFDRVSTALGWPIRPEERVNTQFVLAKPTDSPAKAKRGFFK